MKRFVDLKDGDYVYVVADNKCYKKKILHKKMKWVVDNVMCDDGSYKLIYGLTDEIDESRTCPGDYIIEITIDNLWNDKSTYTFSVDCINAKHYVCADWLYVFSDFETLRNYRDWIYSTNVEHWDDIIKKIENNELN